jgi:hypothetical protein
MILTFEDVLSASELEELRAIAARTTFVDARILHACIACGPRRPALS